MGGSPPPLHPQSPHSLSTIQNLRLAFQAAHPWPIFPSLSSPWPSPNFSKLPTSPQTSSHQRDLSRVPCATAPTSLQVTVRHLMFPHSTYLHLTYTDCRSGLSSVSPPVWAPPQGPEQCQAHTLEAAHLLVNPSSSPFSVFSGFPLHLARGFSEYSTHPHSKPLPPAGFPLSDSSLIHSEGSPSVSLEFQVPRSSWVWTFLIGTQTSVGPGTSSLPLHGSPFTLCVPTTGIQTSHTSRWPCHQSACLSPQFMLHPQFWWFFCCPPCHHKGKITLKFVVYNTYNMSIEAFFF